MDVVGVQGVDALKTARFLQMHTLMLIPTVFTARVLDRERHVRCPGFICLAFTFGYI